MITIDSIYINEGGGKLLLDFLLKRIVEKKLQNNFFLNVDNRYNSTILDTFSYKKFHPGERSRKNAIKNVSDNYLYFSNVPPPIRLKGRVIIYFQNTLLLDSLKVRLIDKIKLQIKLLYIKSLIHKNYEWVVQTDLVKKNLSNSFHIPKNKISVYPFFEKNTFQYANVKNKNSFVYISNDLSHKNQVRLLRAFLQISKSIDQKITLHLTTKKNNKIIDSHYNNLKVCYNGNLNRNQIFNLLNNTEFAIYPSLSESFGLPLVEAANFGCKVIASDLPYVYEIIKPSLTFDPYSVESISSAILKAIESDDLPETKVIVENKLDNFIEYILK
jgi:glycosyltransferase involved in cell wall biosynthesis